MKTVDRRSGQAMVEYVIVLVALMAVVAAMSYFLYAARKSSNRTAALVSSEYP